MAMKRPSIDKVRWSPLLQQFAQPDEIMDEIRALVADGDFTLGRAVDRFEGEFAALIGTAHAIGVGSGTDAIKLSLKAVGIEHGDEVITCANTFIATVGAINELGARPVFVDCDDSFCMDLNDLDGAITPRTRAIVPVHLTGNVVDMPRLMEIAKRHELPVVEDACQSMLGTFAGRGAGTWGVASAFSLHPIKLIHAWGDAGVIVTNDDEMDRKLRLLRNHGLRNRDEIEILGYNSRLDSLQSIVGSWMVGHARDIVAARRRNAAYYDAGFADVDGVRLPPRPPDVDSVYLLYILFADDRDDLLRYCLDRGIEAKVHYPIPLYRQEGLRKFGYTHGDFPVTDRHAREMISFPVDEHITRAEQDYVIEAVRDFFEAR